MTPVAVVRSLSSRRKARTGAHATQRVDLGNGSYVLVRPVTREEIDYINEAVRQAGGNVGTLAAAVLDACVVDGRIRGEAYSDVYQVLPCTADAMARILRAAQLNVDAESVYGWLDESLRRPAVMSSVDARHDRTRTRTRARRRRSDAARSTASASESPGPDPAPIIRTGPRAVLAAPRPLRVEHPTPDNTLALAALHRGPDECQPELPHV